MFSFKIKFFAVGKKFLRKNSEKGENSTQIHLFQEKFGDPA